MRRLSQISFTLLGLFAVAANAQAAGLLEVYQAARQTDPTYQASLAGARATAESKAQAMGALLPQLSAVAFIQDKEAESVLKGTPNPNNQNGQTPGFIANGNSDSSGYSIKLTQTILRFDQFAAYSIGKLQANQAQIDAVLAEQELVNRAAESYFAFLAAKSDLVTAQAERESISSQLEQAQKRFEVGLIAITDVNEAQASYDLADAQLILAEQNMDNAKDVLREIAGRHIDDLPDLRANIPMQKPAEGDQVWVDRAMTGNPQLARLKLQTEIANKQVKAQRAGHLPSLNAQAERSFRDSNEFSDPGQRIESTDTILSLQLSLPIFSGGTTQSKVRQAHFQKLQAEQQLEQTRRSVERETRSAHRGMNTAIRRVQALRQAVQSSESALEATQAGYDVGTRTSVDVLNARSGLFRAQRDYAKSRYDYAMSLIKLHRAEGSLSPQHLLLLDGWLESSLQNTADKIAE